jgi:hypothetical protein
MLLDRSHAAVGEERSIELIGSGSVAANATGVCTHGNHSCFLVVVVVVYLYMRKYVCVF